MAPITDRTWSYPVSRREFLQMASAASGALLGGIPWGEGPAEAQGAIFPEFGTAQPETIVTLDPQKPGFPDWSSWARRVKIDLVALRKYAQAVYATTDEYLATLGDQDLSRPAEVAALGIPSMTVGQLLSFGVLGNALMHCGEISCLKGQQGAKGYPI